MLYLSVKKLILNPILNLIEEGDYFFGYASILTGMRFQKILTVISFVYKNFFKIKLKWKQLMKRRN